ncbi:hypothetical protein FPQ18DRAFT_10399 [Pyronema domesticum]|nr:hypothetical protein FPQ18DRAFT_10399 [Pyronema domesticum]
MLREGHFILGFGLVFFVGIGLLLSSSSLFYGISCDLSLVIYDATLVYRLVTCYAKIGYLRLVIYDWLSLGFVYWILLLSEGILHLLGTRSHREISCLLVHLCYVLIT